MKYADSFEEIVEHNAAGTIYSEWFDVDFANELFVYCTITFAVSKTGNESLTHNRLYRKTPDSEAEVLAFTEPINATATEEGLYGSAVTYITAVGNANMLGTRVRFKSTTTGNAFTNLQVISIAYRIFAKRN